LDDVAEADERESGAQAGVFNFLPLDNEHSGTSGGHRLAVRVHDGRLKFFLLSAILHKKGYHFVLERCNETGGMEIRRIISEFQVSLRQISHSSSWDRLAISSNDDFVFVCAGQNNVQIFNENLEKVHEFAHIDNVLDIVCDENYLYILTDSDIREHLLVRDSDMKLLEVRLILSVSVQYGQDARMADITSATPRLIVMDVMYAYGERGVEILIHSMNKDTLLDKRILHTALGCCTAPVAVTSQGTIILCQNYQIYTLTDCRTCR
jgi:hypothetical protein